MIKTKVVSTIPVSGMWAVSVSNTGEQQKEKVVCMLTIQVTDTDKPDDDHVRFQYVTSSEIQDDGYVDIAHSHLYNTEYYIGLIEDEPNWKELTPEQYLPIPEWKKTN